MKAVVCHHGDFEVQDVAEPEPGKGQILLNVLRCGICGSDLHARHHADELAEATERVGYPHIMRSHEHVVLGHEFVGEIADYGAKTHRRWKLGKRVVAMPMRRNNGVAHLTGLSTQAPGAYAERVLVEESLAFPVTNGISDDHAALTEPMAVSLHAVNRSEIRRRDTAIVIGCGPIGLGVIAMLKAKGVRHIVASDYSPTRRNLAKAMGAHVVVDPSQGSPYEGLEKRGFVVDAPQLFDMALDGMAMLRMTPLPWEPLWREFRRVLFRSGAVVAGGGSGRGDQPETAGDFRVRWHSGNDREHRRGCAVALLHCGGGRLHETGSLFPGECHQQGN